MKYIDEVKAAVREYLKENASEAWENGITHQDADEIADILWNEDSVTGNASGSYTFSRHRAMENVMSDMDTVVDALQDFGVEDGEIAKHFIQEDWEWFDVTARCYVLNQAICEVIEESKEA